MTRFEAWAQHLALLAVGGTGVVYAVLRYLVEPQDPFAVVNHPLEPLTQHLHVLTAPLLVFAAGLIWRRHVIERWHSPRAWQRRTGRVLAIVLPLMIASGYWLQVAVTPGSRRAGLWLHIATSTLWLLGYVCHQLAPTGQRHPESAADVTTDPALQGVGGGALVATGEREA